MDSNSPIFIVGTPRSGTTLMAKILGRHSRLFMPGETHFFSDIYSKRGTSDHYSEEKRDQIVEQLLTLFGRYNEPSDQKRVDHLVAQAGFKQLLLSSPKNYQDLLRTFMETQTSFVQKQRWGNNAPRDIFHINEILRFYPNAKIIVCVRDPRDFLLSYSGKWKITSPEHVQRLKKLYHPVITSYLWKSSMKLLPKIKQMVPKDNLALIKYENLVTEPEQAIKNICSIIEEPFEIQMLEVDSANSSAGTNDKGIFSSSVGRWKDALPVADVVITQHINKNEMVELGYSSEPQPRKLVHIMQKIATTPTALFQALFANKDSRGPLLPYLYTRVKSLFS